MSRAFCLLVALCLLPALLASQQSRTLKGHVSHGGFGGPVVRFTELNGQVGILAGGHAGWVINRRFVLGGGGYGLLGTGIDAPAGGTPGVRPYLSFAYGGLEMQYVDRPDYPAHILLFVLGGGGRASHHAGGTQQNDGVFVAEPGIIFTVHFTPAIHFDIGGTYRFVTGIELPGLTNTNFSGVTGLIGMDFGHF